MTKVVAYFSLHVAVALDAPVDPVVDPASLAQAVLVASEANERQTTAFETVKAMPGVLFVIAYPGGVVSQADFEKAKAAADQQMQNAALAVMPVVGGMQ